MTLADRVFLDAGLFIGALAGEDLRHAEARSIVEAARNGELAACTSVGVLAEVHAALTWVGAQPPQPPEKAGAAVRCLAAAPSCLLILETALPAGLRMLELAERCRLTARASMTPAMRRRPLSPACARFTPTIPMTGGSPLST